MRALGGGQLVVTDHNTTPQLMMEGFKFESIKPLVERQWYVKSVVFEKNPENIDYNACGFRRFWGKGSIIEMQAMELNVTPNIEQWLWVSQDERTKNKIVCCRSNRYRNNKFPWKDIVDVCRDDIVFIGVHDEYGDFVRDFGVVERIIVKNCLEIAQLIAGSRLFIGNQSSPFWIAAGMHHPCIQETCIDVPDSIVPYKNAVYCKDGNFDFEILTK